MESLGPACSYASALLPHLGHRLAQELSWASNQVLGTNQQRVQPFDDRCVAQALGIVSKVMGHDCQYMKAFLKMKTERRIVAHAFHYFDYVFFGLHLGGTLVISTQPRTGADSVQVERLSKFAARTVDLLADSMMLH